MLASLSETIPIDLECGESTSDSCEMMLSCTVAVFYVSAARCREPEILRREPRLDVCEVPLQGLVIPLRM